MSAARRRRYRDREEFTEPECAASQAPRAPGLRRHEGQFFRGPYDATMGPGQTLNVLTRSAGRVQGDRMAGTYDLRPSTAPDSILGRFRFEATRAP